MWMSSSLGFSPRGGWLTPARKAVAPMPRWGMRGGRMRRMRRTPVKAPRRRPAAMQTRMSGGPPGDWKMEEKPVGWLGADGCGCVGGLLTN